MYRKLWMLCWSAVVVLGYMLGVLATGWGVTLAWMAVVTALLVGVYYLTGDAGSTRPPGRYLGRSVVCAAAVVAAAGWAHTIGALPVVVLGALAVLTSPWALSKTGAWGRLHQPQARSRDDSRPEGRRRPSPERARPPSHRAPRWPVYPSAAVRCLSDEELCHSWRASYLSLQRLQQSVDLVRASDEVIAEQHRLVDWRQHCLDEFERRDPRGFRRWLSSGARPAGDPSRYIQDPNASTEP